MNTTTRTASEAAPLGAMRRQLGARAGSAPLPRLPKALLLFAASASCLADPGRRCRAVDLKLDRRDRGDAINLIGCTDLDLSHTWIGRDGGAALARALVRGPAVTARLRHLNFSWASLGASGAVEIDKVLTAVAKRPPDPPGSPTAACGDYYVAMGSRE